jgi:hypothetical protein
MLTVRSPTVLHPPPVQDYLYHWNLYELYLYYTRPNRHEISLEHQLRINLAKGIAHVLFLRSINKR